MSTTIITYICTTLVGLIMGFMIKLGKDYITGEKTEREALKCLLRASIVSQYYVYREIGHIPYYIKASILDEFEAYKGLNGNSFVEGLVKEIETWEVEK